MIDLRGALAELVTWLEEQGFTYALGGALALGVWATPRMTLDIDMTLWVPDDAYQDTLARLMEAGGDATDASAALRSAERDGVSYLRWRGVRLDVFFPSIPFYEAALEARVRLELPGIGPTWVLSAETLAVFKLLFLRPKDLVDVASLIRVRGREFDGGWVRDELIRCVGADDERLLRLAGLLDGTSADEHAR